MSTDFFSAARGELHRVELRVISIKRTDKEKRRMVDEERETIDLNYLCINII